jgi:hypothetical protein
MLSSERFSSRARTARGRGAAAAAGRPLGRARTSGWRLRGLGDLGRDDARVDARPQLLADLKKRQPLGRHMDGVAGPWVAPLVALVLPDSEAAEAADLDAVAAPQRVDHRVEDGRDHQLGPALGQLRRVGHTFDEFRFGHGRLPGHGRPKNPGISSTPRQVSRSSVPRPSTPKERVVQPDQRYPGLSRQPAIGLPWPYLRPGDLRQQPCRRPTPPRLTHQSGHEFPRFARPSARSPLQLVGQEQMQVGPQRQSWRLHHPHRSLALHGHRPGLRLGTTLAATLRSGELGLPQRPGPTAGRHPQGRILLGPGRQVDERGERGVLLGHPRAASPGQRPPGIGGLPHHERRRRRGHDEGECNPRQRPRDRYADPAWVLRPRAERLTSEWNARPIAA